MTNQPDKKTLERLGKGKKHRDKIQAEVLMCLINIPGLTDMTAKNVLDAIKLKTIDHVTIIY